MSEGHSPPRRWGIVEWSLLGAALAAYVSTVRPFYGVTADDAFISFRYGLSWASGCGPVYNCGQPPVEGYSNFLWVALSALVLRLGLDVVAVMRAVGLAGGFCALVLVALVCRRVNRERAAVVAPLLGLASSPFWAVNAVSGLETLVATTSVLGAAYLTLGLAPGGAPPASGGRELRRPLLAGLAWALAYLVRPEGLPLAAVSGIWTLAIGVSRGRSWRASLTRAALVAAGFAFAISLGEFGATLFIVRPDSPTLPVVIFRLLGQPGTQNFGGAMAASVILMGLTGLAILGIERFRVGSIGSF
jgi:hypothetical protein